MESLSLVANNIPPTTKRIDELRQTTPLPAASVVYESNARLIFDILSWFSHHSSTEEIINEIAHTLPTVIPEAGYTRYVHLVCLRSVYQHLVKAAKAPIDLDFEHAFCLFLRDRHGLSCREVAAIVGASEGSVRTRNERSRARAFLKPIEETLLKPVAPHTCINARHIIEDWNLEGPNVGEHGIPHYVTKAVGECSLCEQTLRQRMASLQYFRDLSLPSIPEELLKYPVAPLFVKEGKRFILNWTAAPWYIKAVFEGLLATTLVLGIVLSIPRIKGIYEFWLERRLDLYSVAELASGLGSSGESGSPENTVAPNVASRSGTDSSQDSLVGPVPLAANDAPSNSRRTSNGASAVKPESEFIGRDSLAIASDRIYRIFIKTDSPETTKEQALRLLAAVKYTPFEEGSAGAELPGGVMFDVFVPIKSYKQLEADLARLGESKVMYTRAKERGIPGKARVKVWLQRI